MSFWNSSSRKRQSDLLCSFTHSKRPCSFRRRRDRRFRRRRGKTQRTEAPLTFVSNLLVRGGIVRRGCSDRPSGLREAKFRPEHRVSSSSRRGRIDRGCDASLVPCVVDTSIGRRSGAASRRLISTSIAANQIEGRRGEGEIPSDFIASPGADLTLAAEGLDGSGLRSGHRACRGRERGCGKPGATFSICGWSLASAIGGKVPPAAIVAA